MSERDPDREDLREEIAENAPIAEDGSDVQEVVYAPGDHPEPDVSDMEHRDTGVVTTGEEPQRELDDAEDDD